MFGAGCYFAEDAEKVDQYARPDAGPSGPGHAELAELHARLYREGRTHPGTAAEREGPDSWGDPPCRSCVSCGCVF